MSIIEHLAAKVATGVRVTERWDVLRVYFPGDKPVDQIRKWAESKGIVASFDEYKDKIVSVTFGRK